MPAMPPQVPQPNNPGEKPNINDWVAALMASPDNRDQPWKNAFPEGTVNDMEFKGNDVATYDNKMLQENGGG